jgi:hypothetical protein
MIKLEVLHETNVAGSHGGLVSHCFLRRRRALFRRNGIAPATTAQMTDGDMAIVPQIRVAFIGRAKVNEFGMDNVVLANVANVVFVFHPFTKNTYFSGVQF